MGPGVTTRGCSKADGIGRRGDLPVGVSSIWTIRRVNSLDATKDDYRSRIRPSLGRAVGVELARDLRVPLAGTICIYTMDHRILLYCILTTARHDNAVISQSICDTVVDTGHREIG